MFCDLESRNYLRPFSWKWPNFESTTEYWINIYVYVFSVVKCRDPGEKENAYKETTLDSDPYNCGTQLTFHCRHGYQMYGNSTMICGEDGYFKIPIFYCAKIGKLYINFSSLNDSFLHHDFLSIAGFKCSKKTLCILLYDVLTHKPLYFETLIMIFSKFRWDICSRNCR